MPHHSHRRHARFALILAACASLILVVAAGPAAADDGSSSDPTAVTPDALSTQSAQLEAQVATLMSSVDAVDADNFGGVYLDVPNDTIHLELTAPAPSSLLTVIHQVSASATVDVDAVSNTFSSLQAGQAAMTTLMENNDPSVATVDEVGVDPTTNTLSVHIVTPTHTTNTPSIGGLSAKSVQKATIAEEVDVADEVDVPVTFQTDASAPDLTATRLKDSSPWNGGDFMDNGNSGCTTGVPVENAAGTEYLLGVAHCVDDSTGVKEYNDDVLDSNKCNYTGCSYIGTSSHVYHATGWDSALYSGGHYSDLDWENYQNKSYAPPSTFNGFTNKQASYSTSVVGGYVCPSGAYEGMVCSSKVTRSDETIKTGGLTFEHADSATNSGKIVVGAGDSGGPVISTPSGHINVEGIIEARGTAVACKTYSARGTDCSHTVYYFDFKSMADHWNVHLKES